MILYPPPTVLQACSSLPRERVLRSPGPANKPRCLRHSQHLCSAGQREIPSFLKDLEGGCYYRLHKNTHTHTHTHTNTHTHARTYASTGSGIVRVVHSEEQQEEGDYNEEEDWDEVMAALENPWMTFESEGAAVGRCCRWCSLSIALARHKCWHPPPLCLSSMRST